MDEIQKNGELRPEDEDSREQEVQEEEEVASSKTAQKELEGEEVGEKEGEERERDQLEELRDLLEEEKREKERYQERVVRLQADFNNYKKRMIRERDRVREQALRELMTSLLPVLDNLDRALEVTKAEIEEERDDSDLALGVEMVQRQLMELLKDRGLEEIKALDQQFDPLYHEAVEQVESEDIDEDTVIEVLQKGYLYQGEVIRPSMVRVAR